MNFARYSLGRCFSTITRTSASVASSMTSGMMIGRGNGRDQFGAGRTEPHAKKQQYRRECRQFDVEFEVSRLSPVRLGRPPDLPLAARFLCSGAHGADLAISRIATIISKARTCAVGHNTYAQARIRCFSIVRYGASDESDELG